MKHIKNFFKSFLKVLKFILYQWVIIVVKQTVKCLNSWLNKHKKGGKK